MPTLQLNGTSLFYTEHGSGQPVVLLHAFPVDGRMWQAQADHLSTHWRVIVPDFRGFGLSPGAGPFTVPSMADDIHALLSAIRATACVLAGISMGGYVAMNYARKYPDDLRGLILVDTKDAADDPQTRENRNRMIDVAQSKGSAAVADLMFGKMLSPDTLSHRPEISKTLRAMMEACPAKTIEHALAALRDRPDMTTELPLISMPTLILVGEADALTPPTAAEGMKSRISGSRLTAIPGAGHMSPMEQPSQVNKAIRRFIDNLQ